jgi:hypothetical protein
MVGAAPSVAVFYDVARLVMDLERHFAGAHVAVKKELYAPYDPDTETVPAATISPEQDRAQLERLFDWVERAFLAANFERLDPAHFDRALSRASHRAKAVRLDPDLESIERFAIFHRGRGKKAVRIRPARDFFRAREVEAPTFSRVGIVVRTRQDPAVYLKLFKDVAQDDIDLGLPTVRIRMNVLDKLKLSGSGGAAAISFLKLLKLIAFWAPTIPFKIFLLPLIILLGGGIYGGKTLLDYSKIKASYLMALMEQLYSLHIASNRGVLIHLADLVAEEEAKEILIGYALLAASGPTGCTPEQLAAAARAWVSRTYAVDVDFDVADALAKLDERHLSCVLPDGTTRTAAPVGEAVATLDRIWDDLYERSPTA